jgi:NADPH:quinone reductase-like Zn-dependent oxidoreductase
MKAAVCTKYGPPEVLQISETPKPVPGKGQILVKVHAGAVTASDCIVRGFNVTGIYKVLMGLVIGFAQPRKQILGMVFAGDVESVGEGVDAFGKAQRVFGFDRFGFGCDAEFKCISADGLVMEIPDNLTYEEAAALPFGGLLALHYLRKSGLQAGGKILIYGASGAIGTAAVQLAKHMGAEVTGVCSTRNVALVRALGADIVIDYTRTDFLDQGVLYDVVLNAAGKKKAPLRPGKALKHDGLHVTIDDGTPQPSLRDLAYLSELAEKGDIKAVIDRIYPLKQIAQAHAYVDEGHKKGNVLISLD